MITVASAGGRVEMAACEDEGPGFTFLAQKNETVPVGLPLYIDFKRSLYYKADSLFKITGTCGPAE